MAEQVKNQSDILLKLGIEKLNSMQEEAIQAIDSGQDVMLLSNTGSGKTLAYLLPLTLALDPNVKEVQVLIVVPARELAIQIEQVARNMGAGNKVNAVYGGRASSKDKIELSHAPSILIGTPGRLADHLRKGTFDVSCITTLVLDEFDKSLEIGFEDDMTEIVQYLFSLKQRVLTSATKGVDVPKFVGFNNFRSVDFLHKKASQLELKQVVSQDKDKLGTLYNCLRHIGNQPTVVFCNFKDSIQRISDYLEDRDIAHGCFYGGLEQRDRERALIKFRNGTHQIIIATDLAARGIDVPEIKFIIHYHLPLKHEEFIHRNGRTARMNSSGTALVIKYDKEPLPDYIGDLDTEELNKRNILKPSHWRTIFISGGRKDKISKGDIVGKFFKIGGLTKEELGLIELKNDCAFVSVHQEKVEHLIATFNNTRFKKKKVRVYQI